MSGAIANQLAHAAANTAFLAKGEEIFSRPPEGPWAQFTDVIPCDGQSLEIDAMGPSPIVRELVGTRRFGALRAYARRERVVPISTDALEFSRLQVEKDKTGLLSRRLTDYLSQSANMFEKVVTDKLLANPTCIDGVALISASHPNGNAGAVWSNSAGAVLSPSTFASGIAAMAGLRLENGEPAGFYPTHLMVGPANEKMARDLCGSALRPFPIANTGLEAYASAVAATAIPNWKAGQIEIIINTRFANGTNDAGWFLMDLSRPGVRPMILGEAIAPRAVVVDDPQSEPMIQRSAYQYYVEAYAAYGGYVPHCVYGSVT